MRTAEILIQFKILVSQLDSHGLLRERQTYIYLSVVDKTILSSPFPSCTACNTFTVTMDSVNDTGLPSNKNKKKTAKCDSDSNTKSSVL